MKWELDDNARSGFHYLLLGVVVVVIVRLGWLGSYSLSYRDVPDEERIFRAGYLGLESITTVVGKYSPVERLIGAFGVCVLLSVVLGFAVALLARDRREVRFKISFWAAFALLAPWAIWASLFCPAKRALFKQDAMFIYYHRTTVMDLPLPFTGTMQGFDTSEILGLRVRQGEPWSSGIGYVSEILVRTKSGEEVIGTAWLNRDPGGPAIMGVEKLSRELAGRIDRALGLTPAKETPS